ncbi:uncharacterized protein EV420DRAFT_1518426 [Desarmillaria tabescens]|uniref:Uncharacterized protein n=1 Tax=Armillaria tabescens TaxID=1929756 RepID=A0AA39TLS4_ARMTA|nr:uncharacterized protein EV420DRAFT_1518426 [Desarmillaria tabescens]KAK0463482.1 hypothetical protein EV420DRAFT_1518426 [Desarmillaria tabescens]
MFLSNVEFDDPEQLYSLLKHFPLVKDLTMQAVSFQNHESSNSPNDLNLEKLTLGGRPAPHFLSSFCSIDALRAFPTLRELRVPGRWLEDYSYILYTLRACTSLRILHVTSPQNMITWKVIPPLGLNYIEELRFGTGFRASSRRSGVRALQWWIDSFTYVEGVAPLQKVVLEIHGNILLGSDKEDLWSELDRAVTRPQFSSLQTFTIIFHRLGGHSCGAKDLIWAKFIELRNREVLKVMECQLQLAIQNLPEYNHWEI